MATYTTNYGLHQWEATDDFLRTDFNTDFAKIDAAVKGVDDSKPELVIGSYTGDQADSKTITLGFQPQAVLLFREDVYSYSDRYALMAFPSAPCLSHRNDVTMLEVTAQGFTVHYDTYQLSGDTYEYSPLTNESGTRYRYLAVK